MQIHRLAGLAAALLLALALSACGGGDPGSSSSSGGGLALGSDPVVNGSQAGSSSGLETQEEPLHMMTIDETLTFFGSLNPANLGLEGESMAEYSFYPTEKAIPVDGLPCMKVTVYKKTEAGTNSPELTFLVARDGTAVYRLQDGQAEKLDI